MRLIHKTILVLIFFYFSFNAFPQSYPKDLSFVGLSKDKWTIYLDSSGELKQLKSTSEPRTPSFSKWTNSYTYIGSDAALHEVNFANAEDKIIKAAGSTQAYTQPVYGDMGKRLFLVSLREGASVDTDILVREDGHWKVAVNQRSAQFEPYFQIPNILYYASVHCTEECGHIIQEIWRKDLVSGVSEQVTLTNAISRQPIVSKDGNNLYFSSNKAGNYHIWRLNLVTNEYQQMTTGEVSDESPALADDGTLYFIRHANGQPAVIMQWQESRALIQLPLPADIEDVRDLKINH